MIRDLTNAQYHAHPAISSSDVKAVALKSLAHWKGAVRKSSSAFDLGTAVHALLLEPHLDLVVKGPADRRGNEWKDKKLGADLDGKLLLTSGEYDIAMSMRDAVMQHDVAAEMLQRSGLIAEASFFATDPETGLQIKCRPDAVHPESGLLVDVKTTKTASPEGFAREVQAYGYDIQAAFYQHVLTLNDIRCRPMTFICVEKEPPFAVCVHVLSDSYVAHGMRRAEDAIRKIITATRNNSFTTGWPSVNVIEPPRWLGLDAEADDADDDADDVIDF